MLYFVFKLSGMLRCFFFIGFLVISLSVRCQSTYPDPHYQFRSSGDKLQDRNFYFFTLLQTLPISRQLETDTGLARLGKAYEQVRLLTSEEIKQAGDALERVMQQYPSPAAQLIDEMRRSGLFQLYEKEEDKTFLRKSWENTADAINYIVNGYANNLGMRYPAIDSASAYVLSPAYKTTVQTLAGKIKKEKHKLFFQPAMKTALGLLRLAKRTEAISYEPLEQTLNKQTIATFPATDWDKYPYPVMLVLGASPSGTEAISDMAKSRCAIAAKLYEQKLAPYIIVSGGHVRPPGTRYAEGIEMKRYLTTELKVPANAILVDPYARHTTTNIRNAVRIMWRSGMPVDKRMMCVSDTWHLLYVNSPMFIQRCQTELGYTPMNKIKQEDTSYLTFLPDLTSLHADPHEPLDP